MVSQSTSSYQLGAGTRFALIQHVPDQIRQEIINVGVAIADGSTSLAVHIPDAGWQRVHTLNPSADREAWLAKVNAILGLAQEAGSIDGLRSALESTSLANSFFVVQGGTFELPIDATVALDELLERYVRIPANKAASSKRFNAN